MKTAARIAATVSLASLLAACAPGERVREIDWAKAALARNPAYEILATDEAAGVFTVRDTAGGAVHTLRLEDLVAAPKSALHAQTAAAAAPALAPMAAPAAAPEAPAQPPATDATEPELATNTPARAAADTADTGAGDALASGAGYRITRGDGAAPAAAGTLAGPGYSITRPEKRATNASAEAIAANVEKRSDPIICQGDRLMRIDGETIEFSGDAVIAEKGCDLFISNANIRAGGVGIIARQARVHIVNSTIGGSRASYEASDGAEIYVARSTFAGIGRRFDNATMNDLGGNSYEAH